MKKVVLLPGFDHFENNNEKTSTSKVEDLITKDQGPIGESKVIDRMSSRREELEAKRQRLQELRRQREEKQKEQSQSQSTTVNEGAKEEDINSLVGKLVGDRVPSSAPSSSGSIEANGDANSGSIKKTAVYKSISIQTNEIQEVKKPEKITYNKSVQTHQLIEPSDNEAENEPKELDEKAIEGTVTETSEDIPSENLTQDDQIDTVVNVDESLLTSFFNKSFKIINRVIDEEKDILKTYKDTNQETQTEAAYYQELASLKFDQGIFAIDTSNFFPELILISCGKSVWVYNTNFKKFEYNFNTSTAIVNIQFSHFKSNIIFGTGYNGKLFSWNLESDSKLPYLVSSTNPMNHSYPVLSLNQTNENNGTLISASTDGRICTWTTSMLSKPISPPIDLKSPKSLSLRFDELSPTSVINLPNDHGFLIVGCEDGNIYRVKRFDNEVIGNPDNRYDKIYHKHKGPITSLNHSDEFTNLFISSSFDWTVSLWDVNQPESPLLTIYRNNAIPQASWRNGHSTQLAFIHGNVFELLDLSVDSVIPILKISFGKLLNKFSFDKNGSTVILGSVDGDVKIFDILLKEEASEVGRFKRLYVNGKV
ncbi:Cytoplasmic dynein 1 intermediate chain [Wickerhamomyces ciferrii]|uniref:Cytoplasmic dynein 1 intermediate chain n=1 Tax=Wickerhamomyces ciferrii (strain ATCC 14091 / BCRC 22168 / CBS 111 / JCM 3599 / NBRC 0793 / NRRL Y-1031 F-60-10) TaxID=1206466 RepID=K0KKF7_WICCF|nr:Cytoplasmic dynein 1 intermediate chain [Wickerhamomyces ciferrii]CCH43446.1 Cytoplasmic dynein 1 intermediate chain [Wickerhamomyces ciferrii]